MPKRPLLVFLRQVTLGRFLFVSEIVGSDSTRDAGALLNLQRSVAYIPIDATGRAQDQETLDVKLLKNLAENLGIFCNNNFASDHACFTDDQIAGRHVTFEHAADHQGIRDRDVSPLMVTPSPMKSLQLSGMWLSEWLSDT
jgi:hypothetical protein